MIDKVVNFQAVESPLLSLFSGNRSSAKLNPSIFLEGMDIYAGDAWPANAVSFRYIYISRNHETCGRTLGMLQPLGSRQEKNPIGGILRLVSA